MDTSINTRKGITNYINDLIYAHKYDWVHLKQGEFFVSDGSPVVVSTVLGSCVAVTMHHPKTGTGAITHGFLPDSRQQPSKGLQDPGRFVDSSTEFIYREMLKLGAKTDEIEVKVFGGAQVFDHRQSSQVVGVGSSNSRAALQALNALCLKVNVVEVGGSRSRKLYFLPQSGEVWVKKFSRL